MRKKPFAEHIGTHGSEEQLQHSPRDSTDDGVLVSHPDIAVSDDLRVIVQRCFLRVQQQSSLCRDMAGGQAQVQQMPEGNHNGSAQDCQDQVNQEFTDRKAFLNHVRRLLTRFLRR